MILGLALATIAAVTTGVVQVATSFISREIGAARTTIALLVLSLAWFSPLLLVAQPPSAAGWWLKAMGLGILNTIAFVVAVEAYRRGPLSMVGPISATGGAVTVVLAWGLLGEQLPDGVALSLVPMVLGAAACALQREPAGPGRGLLNPGPSLMVVAVVLIATFTLGIRDEVREAGWPTTLLAARGASVAAAAVLLLPRWARAPDDRPRPSGRIRRPVALLAGASLGMSVAQGLMFASLALAPAWLVGALTTISPAIVVMAGVTLLRERPRSYQVAGALGVALGLALLATCVALTPAPAAGP